MAAAFRLNADRDAVVSAEADGAETALLSLVAQANASRFSHRAGQRFDTLEAVSAAADFVRKRNMPAREVRRCCHLRHRRHGHAGLPHASDLGRTPARFWQLDYEQIN